jgi:hypothetical protein
MDWNIMIDHILSGSFPMEWSIGNVGSHSDGIGDRIIPRNRRWNSPSVTKVCFLTE